MLPFLRGLNSFSVLKREARPSGCSVSDQCYKLFPITLAEDVHIHFINRTDVFLCQDFLTDAGGITMVFFKQHQLVAEHRRQI